MSKQFGAEHMCTAKYLLGEMKPGQRFVFLTPPELSREFLETCHYRPRLGREMMVVDTNVREDFQGFFEITAFNSLRLVVDLADGKPYAYVSELPVKPVGELK